MGRSRATMKRPNFQAPASGPASAVKISMLQGKSQIYQIKICSGTTVTSKIFGFNVNERSQSNATSRTSLSKNEASRIGRIGKTNN